MAVKTPSSGTGDALRERAPNPMTIKAPRAVMGDGGMVDAAFRVRCSLSASVLHAARPVIDVGVTTDGSRKTSN